MRIKKNIELCIDIHDPIGQSDADYIMHLLTIKYAGRCIRECYVHSIDRIIKRGEIIINQMDQSCFGTLPIIVEVTATVFLRGEVITGCKIANVNEKQKIITCESENAHIMIRSDKSLQVGLFINIQVGLAQYTIGAHKAVINGTLYYPPVASTVYQITDSSLPSDELLQDVMSRLKFEEEKMTELQKTQEKSWLIFSNLLYAFSSPQKIDSTSILDFAKFVGAKYIVRDCKIPPTTPNVIIAEENSGNAVPLTLAEVIISVLEDYVMNLRVVREMIGIYSTPELIKSHVMLWNLYRLNKL
jgi:hypothetical protein